MTNLVRKIDLGEDLEVVVPNDIEVVDVGWFPVNMLGGAAYLIAKDGDQFEGIAQFGARVQGTTFRASGYAVKEAWGDTPEAVLIALKGEYRD